MSTTITAYPLVICSLTFFALKIPAEPGDCQPLLLGRDDRPVRPRVQGLPVQGPDHRGDDERAAVRLRRRLRPGAGAGGRRPVPGRHGPAPLPGRGQRGPLPGALPLRVGRQRRRRRPRRAGQRRHPPPAREGRLLRHLLPAGLLALLCGLPGALPLPSLHLHPHPRGRAQQLPAHPKELGRLRHPGQHPQRLWREHLRQLRGQER